MLDLSGLKLVAIVYLKTVNSDKDGYLMVDNRMISNDIW